MRVIPTAGAVGYSLTPFGLDSEDLVSHESRLSNDASFYGDAWFRARRAYRTLHSIEVLGSEPAGRQIIAHGASRWDRPADPVQPLQGRKRFMSNHPRPERPCRVCEAETGIHSGREIGRTVLGGKDHRNEQKGERARHGSYAPCGAPEGRLMIPTAGAVGYSLTPFGLDREDFVSHASRLSNGGSFYGDAWFRARRAYRTLHSIEGLVPSPQGYRTLHSMRAWFRARRATDLSPRRKPLGQAARFR